MLDKIQSFYGFTKMPFGRDLAPAQLHRHHGHAQTVARLTWAITTARSPCSPASSVMVNTAPFFHRGVANSPGWSDSTWMRRPLRRPVVT